jgi:hypothetical protein
MRILPSLALLLVFSTASAQGPLPRLELGVGLFVLDAPDYRGSSESSSYLLPAPYIKYRGDRLRVDEGADGIIFESPDLLFSLSGNLSVPADEETPEREGMDELAALVEVGPSLDWRFLHLERSAWWLRIPAAPVLATAGDAARRVETALQFRAPVCQRRTPRLFLFGRRRGRYRHAPAIQRRRRCQRLSHRVHLQPAHRRLLAGRLSALRQPARLAGRRQPAGLRDR